MRKVIYELLEKSRLCDDIDMPKSIQDLDLRSHIPTLTTTANLKKAREAANKNDRVTKAMNSDERKRAKIDELGWAVFRGYTADNIDKELTEAHMDVTMDGGTTIAANDESIVGDLNAALNDISMEEADLPSIRAAARKGNNGIDPKNIVEQHPIEVGWEKISRLPTKTQREHEREVSKRRRELYSDVHHVAEQKRRLPSTAIEHTAEVTLDTPMKEIRDFVDRWYDNEDKDDASWE